MKQLTFRAGMGIAGVIGAGLFVAVGSHRVLAQQSASREEANAAGPQLKLSPERALQKFEPDAGEEYELGPGDEISLDFPGRPELGGKKIVGPDGRITLSLVGPLDVANKTRAEVAKVVVAALQNYYQEVNVTVNVDKYGSNKIVLIGSVKSPGVQYYETTPTLLDVIARGGLLASSGGGTTTGTGGSTQSDGIPARCAIYRGNDQVVWVDLKTMLQSGNSMADMRLRRNDIVFVPSEQDVFVSVLGNVSHPGAIALRPDSTLVSLLAQAGGMSEGASSKIQVIQPSTGKTSTVSLKSLLTVKGSDEIKLHAGDVIWVPTSGFYKATYVIQRLSPGATMGMAAIVAK